MNRAFALAPRAALALSLVALGAAPPPPGPLQGSGGPTVLFRLLSPENGTMVAPGQMVRCRIRVHVSQGDNQGLALALVDLTQAAANPSRFDLPVGRPGTGMEAFDWPLGFANPAADPAESAYGGSPVGPVGGADLVQIGGAQNTFGVPGPCLGPQGDPCVGQEVDVAVGVGQHPAGQLLAVLAFPAPTVPGRYTLSLSNPVATVLDQVAVPPQASRVRFAQPLLGTSSITFVVQ